MFLTSDIPALFKKGMLKLMASEDGGMRRVAEATCIVEPFPFTLARELGEDIAGHLYTEGNAIRDELESVDLRVRVGLQRVSVRHREELEPCASLAPVSIKDVSVSRVEDTKAGRAWLSLSFVLVFSLEDKAARDFVLDEFGKPLLWSFQQMQRALLDQAALHDAAARLGETGGCSISTPGSEPVEFNADTAKKHRAAAKALRDEAKTH